jgi:hypothetical protein
MGMLNPTVKGFMVANMQANWNVVKIVWFWGFHPLTT